MIIHLRKEETEDLEEITKKINQIFGDSNYEIKIKPYTYEYTKHDLEYHKEYYQKNRSKILADKKERDNKRKIERLMKEVEGREGKVTEAKKLSPFLKEYNYKILQEYEEEFE